MIHETTIGKIAFGGQGVGSLNGKTVFLQGVLVGEKVSFEVLKEKGNHAFGRVRKILEPSPLRARPICRHARDVPNSTGIVLPTCPGCCFQHTSYENEITIKNSLFAETLARSADIHPDRIQSPIVSPVPYNYRNKIVLHAQRDDGDTRLGYFLEDNRTVFDLVQCPLAREEINRMLRDEREKAGFFHSLKNGMTVTFRFTEHNGPLLWRNAAPSKQSWLKESTVEGSFSVPVGSFFQINLECCNKLIDQVSRKVESVFPRFIIDLYCGVGILGISAAKKCKARLLGVDENQPAINCARYNAGQHGVADFAFHCRNLNRISETLRKVPVEDSLMILDPPRSGLSKQLVDFISEKHIPNLLYISCAADTLARDLQLITGKGHYELTRTQLIDMFPRTSHFETVSFLRHL